jgi:hypothetical protein
LFHSIESVVASLVSAAGRSVHLSLKNLWAQGYGIARRLASCWHGGMMKDAWRESCRLMLLPLLGGLFYGWSFSLSYDGDFFTAVMGLWWFFVGLRGMKTAAQARAGGLVFGLAAVIFSTSWLGRVFGPACSRFEIVR